MSKKSIIQRRDLEPLWYKATEAARLYEKAGDCITSVIGSDCESVQYSNHPKSLFFCSICTRYNANSHKFAPGECPCTAMHREAVQESHKCGGSCVYTCPAGFTFWTSSFFCGERFAGAFISSAAVASDRQMIVDKIQSISNFELSPAEIMGHLANVPMKTEDEVQALAKMSQLCAEQITAGRPQSEEITDYDASSCQSKACAADFADRERHLIACLRRGDFGESKKAVHSLLIDLSGACNGNIERFRFKAIELVVMLSRTGENQENKTELVELGSRYLKRIEDSKTTVEIIENMCIIVEMMANKLFSFHGLRHVSALRKAERFIWKNYTRKISLKEIAGVSGLSAPYFSTIFKDEMGENLSNYLNRLRVEKASTMLRETEYPIRGISAACGFVDQSWFSKIFKNYTGTSPCKFREHGGVENERPDSNQRQVILN